MPETMLLARQVLVVEDEYFLADDLDRALKAAGAAVIGPVPSVQAALDLIGDEGPEAAVLDVNLGGEIAFPVADALADRGVPFLFTTGYDQAAMPERHANACRLEKPVETRVVLRELQRLLDSVES